MTDVTGQLGEARVTVGGTGAAVTLIRFIAPPADWQGEVNVEGKAATRTNNVQLGRVNVQGFAPTISIPYNATAQAGKINAEGRAPFVGADLLGYTPTVGEINAQGFRPSNVVYDFRVMYPLLGEAQAKFARFSARIDIIRFLPGMTPATTDVEGLLPAATGAGTLALLGEIRVQGFAPSVTPGRVVKPQVGRVNFTVRGITPDIERQRDIDGPYTGYTNLVGAPAIADVIREGGIFRNPQVGYANVVGFTGTRTIWRTAKPNVRITRVEGRRATVAIPLGFVPSVGYINAIGSTGPRITLDRWQPVASEDGTWAAVLRGAQTWSDVDPASATWSAVEEAI